MCSEKLKRVKRYEYNMLFYSRKKCEICTRKMKTDKEIRNS